jgi:hypothetical protein
MATVLVAILKQLVGLLEVTVAMPPMHQVVVQEETQILVLLAMLAVMVVSVAPLLLELKLAELVELDLAVLLPLAAEAEEQVR